MKCPYCNEEMIKGFLYGDRYALKWLPENKKLLFGIWAKGGIKVDSHSSSLYRSRAETNMCHSCQKMIIDLNQINNQ